MSEEIDNLEEIEATTTLRVNERDRRRAPNTRFFDAGRRTQLDAVSSRLVLSRNAPSLPKLKFMGEK